MRTIKRKGVKLHSGFVFTQYPGKDYAEHWKRCQIKCSPYRLYSYMDVVIFSRPLVPLYSVNTDCTKFEWHLVGTLKGFLRRKIKTIRFVQKCIFNTCVNYQ
jgi:hypothetical protein